MTIEEMPSGGYVFYQAIRGQHTMHDPLRAFTDADDALTWIAGRMKGNR